MFSSGAALAVLDPTARSDDPLGILWRKRLALSSAAAISQLEGRREGQGQLRDAFALRKPGEDPGPAGRMLIGWRALREARALRSADWPARLPGFFDLPPEPSAEVLRDLGARFVGRAPPLRFAAEATREVFALGPAHRSLALWLADALLARALGWDRPVPLLAAQLPRAAFRLEEAWVAACASAWGKGGSCRFRSSCRSDPTRQCAARGKVAAAQAAAQAGAEASDRAARRLFDRLTSLGLVRELTGRPTFRLYGL